MIGAMEKSALSMVDNMEKKVKDGGGCLELDIGDYMANVTIDILSHTLFGSSDEQGKKVLDGIANLMLIRSRQPFVMIPGHRFFLSLLMNILIGDGCCV
jgi:hypothetical protein